MPMMVMTGSSALRSACRRTMSFWNTPLARAVRT